MIVFTLFFYISNNDRTESVSELSLHLLHPAAQHATQSQDRENK